MKKGTKIAIISLIVIALITIPIISGYNSLVNLEQQVDTSYSNIDTQLQRRNDLIPNLVNTVQGYATHEQTIIKEVSDARSKLAGATNVTDQANADTELSGALSRLLVVVEKYPDLKANENFRDLQVQLEGTENRIAIARQDYNSAVSKYNTKVKKFPTNLISSVFGFEEKPLYKASAGAAEVPSVDFNK